MVRVGVDHLMRSIYLELDENQEYVRFVVESIEGRYVALELEFKEAIKFLLNSLDHLVFELIKRR